MPGPYDFYGKDVAEAIDNACEKLGVSHGQLDIEIIATGFAGIFGFARKDAHIRVSVKQDEPGSSDDPFGVSDLFAESMAVAKGASARRPAEKDVSPVSRTAEGSGAKKETAPLAPAEEGEVSPETLAILEKELLQLVELMGFPSSLDVAREGRTVALTLSGEFEEQLIGEDGKVLDSLQYIFRRIADRKTSEQLRVNLDVGDYRARRLEEKKRQAVELAAQVKKDGKTQVIPALSPAERREIHLLLRGDSEIRSRSVGDGMFKKILVYRPGNEGKERQKHSRNRRHTSRPSRGPEENSGK